MTFFIYYVFNYQNFFMWIDKDRNKFKIKYINYTLGDHRLRIQIKSKINIASIEIGSFIFLHMKNKLYILIST